MLPNGFVAIVTKHAVGRSAAITYSPAQGAGHAAGRAPPRRCAGSSQGDFKPRSRSTSPTTSQFKLRRSYADSIVEAVAALRSSSCEKTGERTFMLVTDSARRDGLAARRDRGDGDPVRRLLMASPRCPAGAAAAQAAADGQRRRRATPRRPPPYFGVTEYQLAREKLELDMQRGGFSVYIIADMEGLAGVGPERHRDAAGATAAGSPRARAVPRGADRRGERAHRRGPRRGRDPVHRERGAWRHPVPQHRGRGARPRRDPHPRLSQADRHVDRAQPHGGRDDDRRGARQRRDARASSPTTSPSTPSR